MRFLLQVLWAAALPASELVETADRVVVALDGARMELVVADGHVLGLGAADIGGRMVRPASPLTIPVIAEPWGERPLVVHRMRLAGSRRDGPAVEIDLALSATRDPQALAAQFWIASDSSRLRDHYRMPHWRLPAEAGDPALRAAIARLPADLPDAGTLTLRLEPWNERIEGWDWRGWRESWRLRLAGWQVAGVGWMGPWELDGAAAGLRVVNHRYRGLGGLEHLLAADAAGHALSAFTTTEILPGKAGHPPTVSPAIPSSAALGDRGWSLAHRAGAWICRLGRGAGVQSFDFQYRSDAALASFPERQGELRAMTECHPGDRHLVHSDEERFAASADHDSIPMRRLLLIRPGLDQAAWRSRWQAVDRHVRRLHAAELGMRQQQALPAIGMQQITRMGPNLRSLTTAVDGWADSGVRMLLTHHPGWVNGRSLRDNQEPAVATRGGGDCSIHDWRPLADTAEPWRELDQACRRRGIAIFAWMTSMSHANGDFARRLAEAGGRWAINDPASAVSSGYAEHWNHNPLDPVFGSLWFPAIERVRTEQGFGGIWADSFQNLWMTAIDAPAGDRPFQRAWWERIAAWDRAGVTWMAESTAAPGLSCSVEVGDRRYEDAWWFLQHTVRWYRMDDFPDPGTPAADRLAFRLAANAAWAAPMANRDWFRPAGITPIQPQTAIPSFAAIAHAYLAALPSMGTSEILPDDGGVLWWRDDPREGVWFSFADKPVPAGVVASGIVDAVAVQRAAAHAVYRVRADAGLAQAFARPRP